VLLKWRTDMHAEIPAKRPNRIEKEIANLEAATGGRLGQRIRHFRRFIEPPAAKEGRSMPQGGPCSSRARRSVYAVRTRRAATERLGVDPEMISELSFLAVASRDPRGGIQHGPA
jgi:hypothetical protein